MIRLENVSKTYQTGVPALNDISLNIEAGEFVFITGPSGSGKSTLIKLMLHEFDPRRNIGCVFQDFRLLPDRNVYENVAFAMKVTEASTREIKKRVPLVLSMVGLAAKYRSLPKHLSGGEQQRVAIARALVNNPKIILADEPTGNLDNNNAWEIMDLLKQINDNGTTVIVVTHNMEIIERMKKRVITIEKGSLVSDVDPEDQV